MTKIIAFGHFKQSGKSTSCDFLASYIKNRYNNNTDFYGNEIIKGLEQNVCPVKIYSFADKLKEFCMDVLGLTHAQCYGSDDDKNSLTHLRWENMPGVVSIKEVEEWLIEGSSIDPSASAPCLVNTLASSGITIHESGFMTAREVLQYFGTGICRKMYPNVWIDACLRQIKKDNCIYALIADCRFSNEGDAIKSAGGRTIGFQLRPFPEDQHSSEVDMIGYKFDALIDNRKMSLTQKNDAVLQVVKSWGWL